MSDEKVIDLGSKEIDPKEAEGYRERIRAAKSGVGALKGTEPVGGEKRPQMPFLQRPQREVVSAPEEGVQPRPKGSPVLRPETAEKLEAALKAGEEQKKAEDRQEGEKKAEDKVQELFDAFDFGDMGAQVERILNNKQRREIIEGRCEPMNFDDLLLRDEVQQRVPILPSKFEPLFRSITPLESLYIKRRMARETINTEQYLGEKYNLLLLTCCLVDINGTPLPDHRSTNGEPDDKLFDEKLQMLMKKSGYIVADLSVNYLWFDIRVRKLISPDALGNG